MRYIDPGVPCVEAVKLMMGGVACWQGPDLFLRTEHALLGYLYVLTDIEFSR